MFILGLFLEGVLFLFLAHRFRKSSRVPSGISLAASSKQELLGLLEERLQYVQELNVKHARLSDMELTLYEVTKSLSKFIDTQDVLNAFRETMHNLLHPSDCAIVDEELCGNYRGGYSLFKINTGGEKTKYFAIKDSKPIERVRVAIMVNQLELFLKRSRLYAEIQRLSITDGLTACFVRRYFLERLKQEIQRSEHNNLSLSLLLIDVDNFKSFNDTYGHITGDAVLKEVVKILQFSLRQIDMCARYGGEEFCIMLPSTNREGALLAAERLRANVQEARIKAFNETLKCTISVGLAVFPEDGRQISGLLDKADKALYRAKAGGRNRVSAA